MEIICLEDSAFQILLERVIERIKEQNIIKEEPWIPAESAMAKLNIKSKTTLQKLRDEGRIRYTQPQKKIILYDVASINEYLNANAKETF